MADKSRYLKYKDYQDKYRERNSLKRRSYTQRYNQRLRDELFELLGKECSNCGFSDKRALQIDHVMGGGGREIGCTKGIVALVYINKIKQGSRDYQILCANCNWIKRHTNNEVRKV